MSTTSQVTTLSDMVTNLSNRIRVSTGVTATDTQLKTSLNTALHDMHLGLDYRLPWAERRAVLRTQASYTTGTVSTTKGSTAVVGVSTLWSTNNDFGVDNARTGGKIVFSGSRMPYEVTTVTDDTNIVLAEKFTETSLAAGSTYTYYEDEYALAADFLRPIDMQRFSLEASVELISRTDFRRRFPINYSTLGRPSVATILDLPFSGNTTPVRKVKLASAPNDFYQIPYTYVTSYLAVSSAGAAQANMSADSDEPIVPLRYRHAIIFHALYNLYRDKKDDTRSQEAKSEYVDIMTRIMMDTEVGGVRPQLRPNVSGYVRHAKSPYSRGGGGRRFDRGGFDSMED